MSKRFFRARDFPTPFGKISLPAMEIPRRGLPHVDARRKKALKHAVATDLTGILGFIPYVGNLVGGQISDLHGAEIYKILTPDEMAKFVKADKQIPSNGLALLYSFVGG